MFSLASELFRRGNGSGLGLPPVAKVLAVLAIVVAGCGAPAALAADRGCLPLPGAWMERFKQALAFPMYGAAVWLVWVLVRQVGADAIAPALGGMVLIAFAAWLYANTRAGGGRSRRLGASAAVVVVLLALVGGHMVVATGGATREAAADRWQPYSEPTLAAQPVFLNFTAAWCISCLAAPFVVSQRPKARPAVISRVNYL